MNLMVNNGRKVGNRQALDLFESNLEEAPQAGRAAGGAHAPPHPGGVRRPGGTGGGGHLPAQRHRGGHAPDSRLLGPAGLRQDHPGAHRRQPHPRPLPAGQRGHQRGGGGAQDPHRGGGAQVHVRDAHHPLHRRDPPFQQGPAGRPAAGGGGRGHRAHRRHHREPLLRGELGPGLPGQDLPPGAPLRRGHHAGDAAPPSRTGRGASADTASRWRRTPWPTWSTSPAATPGWP